MSSLGAIFNKNKRLEMYISERRLEQRLKKAWPAVMGHLSDQLFFSSLRRGVLTLITSNYMWVNEIDFYKDKVLAKVNEFSKGKKKRVFRLIVRYSDTPDKDIKMTKMGYEERYNRTLEDNIRIINENRRRDGERLCSRCGLVYTKKAFCGFCRVEIA